MPTEVNPYTRVMAWLNVFANVGIVGTGGLVRLTGSGLGCDVWPYCTGNSLFPTPELGIHGLIEFGNRTLTGVLVVVALLAYLSVRRTDPNLGLRRPAFLIGIIIIVQAVVGGITVLLQLDPRIVGIHFLFSAALAALAGLELQRVRLAQPLPAQHAFSGGRGTWFTAMTMTVFFWIVETIGVLTTGSGPHAGDELAARNGLDPVFMHHFHAWSGYALLATIVVMLLVASTQNLQRTLRLTAVLMVMVLVQIIIGVFQARTGLPIIPVAVHMLLAVSVLVVLSVMLVTLRRELAERA